MKIKALVFAPIVMVIISEVYYLKFMFGTIDLFLRSSTPLAHSISLIIGLLITIIFASLFLKNDIRIVKYKIFLIFYLTAQMVIPIIYYALNINGMDFGPVDEIHRVFTGRGYLGLFVRGLSKGSLHYAVIFLAQLSTLLMILMINFKYKIGGIRVNKAETTIDPNAKCFCRRCGNEIFCDAVICPKCGVPTGAQRATVPMQDDGSNTGLNVLSFFIPIVGIVLYFVYQQNYPIKAKGVLKWALISLAIGFVASIFYGCAVASLLG